MSHGAKSIYFIEKIATQIGRNSVSKTPTSKILTITALGLSVGTSHIVLKKYLEMYPFMALQ